MKRFISFVLLAALAAMLTGIVSCKKTEEPKPEEDLPTKFQEDTFVELELSPGETEYTGSISIKNENGKAVTYSLDIMGQQDLDDYYNSPNGSDYKVVPEGICSFPDAVTFASGETEKSVAFTVDAAGLFDKMVEEGESSGVIPDYALPIWLSDDEVENGSWLIYGLKVKYNRFSFSSEDVHVKLEKTETPVEIKASIYAGTDPVANPVAIEADLVLPDDPQTWLNEYNTASGKQYALLPEAYYTVGKLSGAASEQGSTATLILYKSKDGSILPVGEYALPLKISAESLTDIIIDPEPYVVTVTNTSHIYESAEIDKTTWKMIYASAESRRDGSGGGEGAGAESLIDGNIEGPYTYEDVKSWVSPAYPRDVFNDGAAFIIDLGEEQMITSTGLMHYFDENDYWNCNRLGKSTWYAATESEFVSGTWKEFASYDCVNSTEAQVFWSDVEDGNVDNGNSKGRYVKLVLGKPLGGSEGVFMLHEISLKGVSKIDGADYNPVPATEKYPKPAGAVRIMTYDIMNNSSAASVISEIKPDFAGIQTVGENLDAVASSAGLSAKYSDNAGHAVLANSSVKTEILKKEGSFEAALMETEKCVIISTSFQTGESDYNQAQVSELSKALVEKYGTNPEKPVFLMCDCGDPFGYNFANIYWLKLWGWRPLNQLYATTYTGNIDPAKHEPGMNCIDCVFVWEYWSYNGTNGMPEYIDYKNLFTVHADYKYPVEGTDVHYPVFVDITFK